jgi:hypothetical protein
VIGRFLPPHGLRVPEFPYHEHPSQLHVWLTPPPDPSEPATPDAPGQFRGVFQHVPTHFAIMRVHGIWYLEPETKRLVFWMDGRLGGIWLVADAQEERWCVLGAKKLARGLPAWTTHFCVPFSVIDADGRLVGSGHPEGVPVDLPPPPSELPDEVVEDRALPSFEEPD